MLFLRQLNFFLFLEGDELVPFSNPLIIEGPVEKYLGNLEFKMRSSLKEILKKTKDNLVLMSHKREKWLETHPGQLCIVASLLKFTNDCVECLIQCKELNEKSPLKFIKNKQRRLLLNLSGISRKELNSLMRSKISSLITIELHSRDIIDRMLKSSNFNRISVLLKLNQLFSQIAWMNLTLTGFLSLNSIGTWKLMIAE